MQDALDSLGLVGEELKKDVEDATLGDVDERGLNGRAGALLEEGRNDGDGGLLLGNVLLLSKGLRRRKKEMGRSVGWKARERGKRGHVWWRQMRAREPREEGSPLALGVRHISIRHHTRFHK